MPSRDEQRAAVVENLSAHLLKTGLAKTSLRQLASAANVSDRMLLYYFDSKADALAAVLANIAGDLTSTLQAIIPEGTKLPPADLIEATTSLVLDPKTKPFFRLWAELLGAAARKEPPYEEIATLVADGFLVWIENTLEGGTAESRHAMAGLILAMIDGLALLAICSPLERVAAAAEQMAKLRHPDFE